MTPRRAASIFFGIALLAVWLAAASGVGGPNQVVPVPAGGAAAPSPQDQVFAEVEERTAELRERLDTAPMLQQPARNPFEFAPRPDPPAQRAVAVAEPDVPALPTLPPRPLLNLVGIGEDRTPEGAVVRTAVISGASGLFLVKNGDEFLGRFRVSAIGADAVELADSTDGTAFQLALR